MNPARGIWKRLLWREYREGRAAVLLGFLIPILTLRPAAFYGGINDGLEIRQAMRVAGALGVHLVILFWAVARGDNKRKSADFEMAHLPISPMAALTSSFIVPALAAALVGAAFGWWIYPAYALYGAIDVMTTYAFGYFFSAVTFRWLGVLMGVTSMVMGKLIEVTSLAITGDVDAVIVMASCAVGAGVGLFVFTKLIGKKPLPYRQFVSLTVLALFGLLPAFRTFDPSVFHWTLSLTPEVNYSPSAIGYNDPRTGSEIRAQWGIHGLTTMHFRGDVTRPFVKGDFEGIGMLKTIGIRDRRYVYFARQCPESSAVMIFVWDTPYWHRPGTTRYLAEFEARRMAIPDGRTVDAVSPDGHYALVTLNALIGDGQDHWIVNLRTGKAAIFKPAVVMPPHLSYSLFDDVTWTHDYALIPGERPMVIDLKSMSLVPFKIPLPKAGAR